ncbi:bacillithiol biosynthesis deacetylase BshB1 [Fictibacillus aquaticus]|uniref:Bacillithiol biosynthesis deacetylase BshB1 n=1 Tax=Fictibacillus aquaticus TaxID=2021314 RepID=A0A235FC70_9BACL|nr:bacillithiol biosynthesis deacetylase BshB1 [Fictibacillus aquaticus]OYD58547.1 bacillithiol biosynthesis deacetylase BshB1 [Fictibacillus aquaticus]
MTVKQPWLAFGAHADDVEIGMAGTIKKETASGRDVYICDLTKAELSSNGTPETRLIEAEHAAVVLGVKQRFNLGLPDRGLYLSSSYIAKLVKVIRSVRPEAVFAPYWEDRHPDHGHCARLVEEAVFSAAVRMVQDEEKLPPHRVNSLYFYAINGAPAPHALIDVSDVYHFKTESLNAYASQFKKQDGSYDTPLVNGYIDVVSARERLYGKEAAVEFAEGFLTKKPILLKTL